MNEPDQIGDVLASFAPLLDSDLRKRCRVLRTKRTEERAPIDRELRLEVYRRDNFCCVWCGSGSRLELDHIAPWSAGGADSFDNLRTLCHDCNEFRSNYSSPVDDRMRRFPSGFACVYCDDELCGDPELTAIHCRTCESDAPGIPCGIAVPIYRREIA